MSKLGRALALVAMLAAMNLTGLTAVAQAHPTDQPSSQADTSVRRLLADERSSIPNSTTARPRLLLDEERSSILNIPNGGPAQPTSPVRQAQPSRHAGWLTPALSVLAAVLALAAGVAVVAARRAHRSQRAGQTA
jgi:hypothetical protein